MTDEVIISMNIKSFTPPFNHTNNLSKKKLWILCQWKVNLCYFENISRIISLNKHSDSGEIYL
jgi:hypothetical protein